MSDTPRTDAAWETLPSVYEFIAEMKRMERELNAVNERIKRLESVENSHADVLKAIDNWMQQHKSKEAKP